jgi:hypothetical protein
MQAPLGVLADPNVGWVRESSSGTRSSQRPASGIGVSPTRWSTSDQRGLNVLGLLVHSVGWANGRPGSQEPVRAMPDLDAYRTYVRATVTRFRASQGLGGLERPNLGVFWEPRPDPRQYATLLRAAAGTIRRRPGRQVVLAASARYRYLERVVDAAGWDAFDILAAHPYIGSPNPYVFKNAPDPGLRSPERGYQADGDVAKLVAFVSRRGGNKPIWLTEIGWSTAPMGSGSYAAGSEELQANYLVRGMVQTLAAGAAVERVFWYNWNNNGPDRGAMEDNFGLVDAWSTPKPAAPPSAPSPSGWLAPRRAPPRSRTPQPARHSGL